MGAVVVYRVLGSRRGAPLGRGSGEHCSGGDRESADELDSQELL